MANFATLSPPTVNKARDKMTHKQITNHFIVSLKNFLTIKIPTYIVQKHTISRKYPDQWTRIRYSILNVSPRR